jgi:hypothetical protein
MKTHDKGKFSETIKKFHVSTFLWNGEKTSHIDINQDSDPMGTKYGQFSGSPNFTNAHNRLEYLTIEKLSLTS